MQWIAQFPSLLPPSALRGDGRLVVRVGRLLRCRCAGRDECHCYDQCSHEVPLLALARPQLQRELQAVKLLIVDELGYVPLSPTGAELLFEVFSQRYERGSTIVTSNLPFEDWTSVLGSERLTGALLDRLTHHVHILSMNGDSYRLKQSAGRRRAAATVDAAEQNQATAEMGDQPRTV